MGCKTAATAPSTVFAYIKVQKLKKNYPFFVALFSRKKVLLPRIPQQSYYCFQWPELHNLLFPKQMIHLPYNLYAMNCDKMQSSVLLT
jgi:hypothetical protein